MRRKLAKIFMERLVGCERKDGEIVDLSPSVAFVACYPSSLSGTSQQTQRGTLRLLGHGRTQLIEATFHGTLVDLQNFTDLAERFTSMMQTQ